MSKQQLAIIDYGMGNLHSVASAVGKVAPDLDVIVTSDSEQVRAADRVIFPGVGAIRDCMGEIRRLGFDTLIQQEIHSGKPVLAICVGMQALMDFSEENNGIDCLGILPGSVNFFGRNLHDENGEHLKVPHMGWNQVKQTIDHPVWQHIDDMSRFYFVHSYFVVANNAAQVAGQCHYSQTFCTALSDNNLFAVQFHPEKSHHAGLQLLQNFVNWNGKP